MTENDKVANKKRAITRIMEVLLYDANKVEFCNLWSRITMLLRISVTEKHKF